MSIVGKYDPKTRQIRVDTEAGDKIARALVYTAVTGAGATAGALGAGNLAVAAGGAVSAVAFFYAVDKSSGTLGQVEIIAHEVPQENDLAGFLPTEDRQEIDRIRAAIQGISTSSEGRLETHTMSDLPVFQKTGDLRRLGLNIAIEHVDPRCEPSGVNYRVNACLNRPKAPRGIGTTV